MKLDDTHTFQIAKSTAVKIVGICCSTTALQTRLYSNDFADIKKLLSSDTLIQKHLKDLLNAGNLVQFNKRLCILKNTAADLVKLSQSKSFDFIGKSGLHESLKKLEASLLILQDEMAGKPNGTL